jgi:hypothetical protein
MEGTIHFSFNTAENTGQAVMILERAGKFVGIKKMENIPS